MHRHYAYFTKMLHERRGMTDDPLMFVIDLVKTHNTTAWRYNDGILRNGSNVLTKDIKARKLRLQMSQSTKTKTYLMINPDLKIHLVYHNATPFHHSQVSEYHRISFTRFRTSSHRLKVETDRWARIHHDMRLCDCGKQDVQDEQHIIKQCHHLDIYENNFPMRILP